MEKFRDVGKSERKANQVKAVIKGLQDLSLEFIHDHMHYEDGVLVEDDPFYDDGEEQMRLAREANETLRKRDERE